MANSLSADDALREAMSAFEEMNLPLADSLCEDLLDAGVRHSLVLKLTGQICMVVGEFERAVRLFEQATLDMPGDSELSKFLNEARTALDQKSSGASSDERPRYLLIREWGYGFCSELDHALSGLLLAELTNRIPIVYWGTSSLFRDEGDGNAWDSFFEPVSPISARELIGKNHTFFPPKWNDENLFYPEVNRMNGYASRMAGFYFLNALEDVAVADIHFGMLSIQPWIRPSHPLYGLSIQQLYRYIVKKYLVVIPSIATKVDSFVDDHLAGRRSIAVQVRGGDKNIEDGSLIETNQRLLKATVNAATEWPDAVVFMLTDDARFLDRYTETLGDRLVTTQCFRVDTDEGLHYITPGNKRSLGMEIVCDLFIAARCDRFLGAGTTNVASMILHLKDWSPENLTILGEVRHYFRNHFLHRWHR